MASPALAGSLQMPFPPYVSGTRVIFFVTAGAPAGFDFTASGVGKRDCDLMLTSGQVPTSLGVQAYKNLMAQAGFKGPSYISPNSGIAAYDYFSTAFNPIPMGSYVSYSLGL